MTHGVLDGLVLAELRPGCPWLVLIELQPGPGCPVGGVVTVDLFLKIFSMTLNAQVCFNRAQSY